MDDRRVTDLTERDEFLIREQCRLQGAESPEQIAGFRFAYHNARRVGSLIGLLDPFRARDIGLLATYLGMWAYVCEPLRNPLADWRTVNVQVGGRQCPDWQRVPDLMRGWSRDYLAAQRAPAQLYHDFELIHPFADGNGRVGHLVWAIAVERETGDWPQTLPPNLFGDPREAPWGTL